MTQPQTLTVRVKLAFCYPEQLEKIKQGNETITYRKANSPTRLARPTDWNTWYEDVEVIHG